jgi:hypothetical protein
MQHALALMAACLAQLPYIPVGAVHQNERVRIGHAIPLIHGMVSSIIHNDKSS